ncbi:hypothetical protein [Polaribacter sp. Hel1_85]|uniref:hypothetical protein n=1 Tax=Polaribacter sp. Hel1_85 TaxID=1250005 RepID=UPI00052D6E46|nr:hypothetical protein [Polaribacter sp. Hel1_85]KGL58373.1 hypothetical protein PHEL85_3431 [Polaribacter sp. Hel1_85]
MPYKIEDLDFKSNIEGEQKRTRKIFEDLKDKSLNNEKLTEHEKDFFCLGVKGSNLDDGKLKDYSSCENYRFKDIYLSYLKDLSGKSTYEKVRGVGIYNPSSFEIKKDLAFLESVKNKWQKTISVTNHSEKLLREISKETRTDLKKIEKNKGKLLFNRDKKKYLLNKTATLLQSKYIYCISLQIFELFDSTEFVIKLNNQEIEIDEYSIIHILNRHYAQITKTNPTKSFHNEDFEPKYLNKRLRDIFIEIENSGLYSGDSIRKITFKFNNVDYQIWANERTKQVKNNGNIKFNRLETFYPLTDLEELNKLKNDYELLEINEELSIYLKK